MVAQERGMGRVAIDVELSNDEDIVGVKLGLLRPEAIRHGTFQGIVDSGATQIVIPESVAQQLGLSISGKIKVRYADGRTSERPIAERLRLAYGGRESIYNAIVEPNRDTVLVGAIVLEDLDFLIDCKLQRLVPRDPEHIITEVE